MRQFSILLSLITVGWSSISIYSYNAPGDPQRDELEIRCRYGLCEDRDMEQIARFRSFETGAHQDPVLLRKLLRQSPASPELWCGLAEALAESGSPEESQLAFDHAISLAPASPPVLLRAGIAGLLENRVSYSLPLFQRIFLSMPEYPPHNIFGTCRRLGVPSTAILESVLPPNQMRTAAAYLRFLHQVPAPQDAAQAWNWIAGRNLHSPGLSASHAEFLLRQNQPQEAHEVWSTSHSYEPRNRIFNPGFENSPAGPFDWQFDNLPGGAAHIAIDPSQPHSGEQSLRVSFDGSANIEFRHAFQLVFLPPGNYELSVWARCGGLTSDQGAYLTVAEVSTGRLIGQTKESIAAREPWRRLTAELAIGPAPMLARISLIRSRSRKIDSKIKGDLWLDDLQLTETTQKSNRIAVVR